MVVLAIPRSVPAEAGRYLVKSRQVTGEPRGVLERQAGEQWFRLSRRPAAPDLADLVEHCWTVRWDLRGRDPYPQHVLTHPSVHVVVERDRSEVVGVVTGRFTRVLEGRGRAFGIKFRPAGFHPFLGSPVAALTNRMLAISDVFGPDGGTYARRIESLEDESQMADAAEAFVRSRLPAPDPVVAAINGVVARIMQDREITRVAHVVDRSGMTERRLQRLFAEYVGVNPKWVIRRYRLHEAAERLAAGGEVDLAALAVELGYFDQAHFAKDFRAIVGRPPAGYARAAGAATVRSTGPSFGSGSRAPGRRHPPGTARAR